MTARQDERGLILGLLALGRTVGNHRALDRLIRGRVWIGLIAFALIGIVTLQLIVLQLNASIGRSLVREATLQRENATASIENSELAAGELVESQAERLGMQLVPIGSLRFLWADPRADVQRAADALHAPAGETTATSSSSSSSSSGENAGDAAGAG